LSYPFVGAVSIFETVLDLLSLPLDGISAVPMDALFLQASLFHELRWVSLKTLLAG
jgi:hypothetical protein